MSQAPAHPQPARLTRWVGGQAARGSWSRTGGQPGGRGEGAEVAGEPVRGERVAAEAGEDVAAVMVTRLLPLSVLAGAVGAPAGIVAGLGQR
jgi:hypothetical protein